MSKIKQMLDDDSTDDIQYKEFNEACIEMYGETLTGKFRHFCPEFDYLPIDNTCSEFKCCTCNFEDEE